MAHQSLYRRYRPGRFGELRGQHHVVQALRNAVREGRHGHAYLFSGPRGTGKTSAARILAKALNCEQLEDGEPCGRCEPCRSIEAGSSYDLQELDAASNNKVEDVRELIKSVALGSPGRTKVYILDEVHMLSPAAANALLKTLEEPPAHVVFVLATTDPHKVLPTIRSRTQHFEFHLIPAGEMGDFVRWVSDEAELSVSDDAVEHVVRAGGGSARDTLTALDQVVAAGEVTERAEPVGQLVDALVRSDTGLALGAVADAAALGRDPRVLGESFLARLRDVFLCRMQGSLEHLSTADREQVAAWAEQLGDRTVTRALEAVGAALLEMRQAPDPRIPLEVALVRLTRPGADVSVEALLERIERLERALADGERPSRGQGSSGAASEGPSAPADAARAAMSTSASARSTPAPPPPPPPPRKGRRSKAEPPESPADAAPLPDRDQLTLGWADGVLPKLGGLTRAMFAVGRFVTVEDGAAVMAFDNEVHRHKCEQKRPAVEAALREHFGLAVPLRLVVDTAAPTPAVAPAPTTAAMADEADTIDVRDLTDAPADPRTGVDRLTDAFPGAQLVQEERRP